MILTAFTLNLQLQGNDLLLITFRLIEPNSVSWNVHNWYNFFDCALWYWWNINL